MKEMVKSKFSPRRLGRIIAMVFILVWALHWLLEKVIDLFAKINSKE